MSVRTLSRVWEGSRHAGSELLMLLAIADFADDNGRAYPSITTLANKCRTKPRYAMVLLEALSRSGELEIRKHAGPMGRGGRTNLYRVIFDQLTGSAEVVHQGAPVNPSAPVHPGAGSGEPGFREVVHQGAPKPSLNRQEPSESVRARKKPVISLPAGFELSQRVKAWASEKGFCDLEAHLEHFVGKARAKGYTYADWDAALMNAIREDWAGLRKSTAAGRKGAVAQNASFESTDYTAEA